MRAPYPPAIGSAACAPRFPIRIAAGVPPHLARRDRRGVLTFRSAGLAQFRSAALGGASLIAGLARVGARICVTVGARVQRVFVSPQKGLRRSLHAPTIASENPQHVPNFSASGS